MTQEDNKGSDKNTRKVMNVNELMIGDFVKFCRVEEVVPYMRVVSIDEGYIRCYDGGFFTFNPNDIEPIPLTEEILVNNGFERIDTTIGNYALCINVENIYDKNDYSTREFYRIGTYLSGGYFDGQFEIENRTQEEYTSCKKRCKYVHELQHALRLCGIEKEIIL